MKEIPVIQPAAPAAPASTEPPETTAMTSDPAKRAELLPSIVKALSAVYDPELPVNIYDLGLIYDVIVDASATVGIRMTLTAPACPAAQFLPGQVREAVRAVPGVADVKLDVVWEPPWDRERMSEEAKLQLGLF
jgi:FeS assembly SUF system protein